MISGWQPVLDALQERRDPERRSLPGLLWDSDHPLPLPRVQGQPAVGIQRQGINAFENCTSTSGIIALP